MKIIGHRGAAALAPENTFASFIKAIEHNVDEIELDLRVTSNGIVVVHHDPAVSDPAGNALDIRTNSLVILQKHKPDLLTFDDFIKHISAPVPLIIEVKPEQPLGPIIAALRKILSNQKWNSNDIAIASFDMSTLRSLRAAFPSATMVVNESWSGVRGSWRARQLGTKRISMNQRWLWRGFLRTMQRGGYQISPYTVNSPKQARKWSPYVYGVITDNPELLGKQP